MSPTPDQQKNNTIMNKIFIDIAQLVYSAMVAEDGAYFKAVVEFDGAQKVANIQNLSFSEKSLLPSLDDIALINNKSSEILSLPDVYRLKSLLIEVRDGRANATPTYLK